MRDRQADVAYRYLSRFQNTSCLSGARTVAGEVPSAAMLPEIPFVPNACGRVLDSSTTEPKID